MSKLSFLLSQYKTKNDLHCHRVDIDKNRKIYQVCNALPQTWLVTGSNFCDLQFAKTKNWVRRQTNVHLSAKLTKAFKKYFQILWNFLPQEIFSLAKNRLEFS